MPKGVCPECGNEYNGWALIWSKPHKKHRICECGCLLLIER